MTPPPRQETPPETVRAEPIWHEAEEGYLKQLHDLSLRLSKKYMDLYKVVHAKQTNLRLPAIIMSSLSGVASFGTTTFPSYTQRYVSIAIGLINVSIAMIQTYESYLKIGDIVAKSLTVSTSLKKLADDIFCELFIPVVDRNDDGIVFLRDCANRYQVIIEQAPPFMDEKSTDEDGDVLKKKITDAIRVRESRIREERVEMGRTFRPTLPSDRFRPTLPEDRILPPNHVYSNPGDERIVIDASVAPRSRR